MHSRDAIRELGRRPIVVAPMAGGPSTPKLVVAAGSAGALGFLAGGYKTVEALHSELDAVQASTDAPFGVNVFVPGSPSGDSNGIAAYVASLATRAKRLGAEMGVPCWDDDAWEGKLELLLARSPAIVSFTFGCPPREIVAALKSSGSIVAVTVTTPQEAVIATQAQVDCLCVQGFEAGAHRGSFVDDDRPGKDYGLLALIAQVSHVTDLPILAAGGISGPRGIAAVMAAGATWAQLGTAFLRCPESGASATHKAALADPRFETTAVTRAFSGRRARGLINRFMLEHPHAPAAYPEINNATRPLRAAAGAAEDADWMSLHAGQGFRLATDRPAGEIVERLTAETAVLRYPT